MHNLCIFCGRLVEKPELKELDNGKKVTNVTLSIPRKVNGEQVEDLISFSVWNQDAEALIESCNKDDILAIRGNIRSKTVEVEDINVNMLEVNAQKICCIDKEKATDDIYQSQVFLVGRLVRTPELNITDSGKKVSNLTIALNRSYKNSEGVYETDFIPVTAWGNTGETVSDYCRKGDLIGVKGSLFTRKNKVKDKEYNNIGINASKITFMSVSKDINQEEKSKKKDEPSIEVS